MGSVSDLPLLVSISVALSYALVGGLLARRVGLPPIVGYMLAGVALGPFTPGYQGDGTAIHQLAEFGVILLMFGVGLHFSFKDLWQVRDIAIPGAILQMTIATIIGYSSARLFGASPAASLVLGLSISIASTVVLMRGLMDTGQLDSLHGRVAIGWLVLQDLAAVVILVLLPLLSVSSSGDVWSSAGLAVGKALLFVVLMLAVGPRVVPALVARAAQTRSREIFVLVALTAAAGTALVSYKFFGVSLALGAFLAGVIIGQSPFSHQVGADLLPFREAFAVLFFVSVGMLVNPSYLVTNWVEVLADQRPHRGRQQPDRAPGRVPVCLSGADLDRHRGGAEPDRRVLIHPRPGGRLARAALSGSVLADPGGRHHFDHLEPVHVQARRTG